MKILGSTKLGFDDVLIRPKSSPYISREQIQITRVFDKWPNAKSRELECVPIMASNMDSTGTFAMADVLSKRKWITCLHKHYPLCDLMSYYKSIEHTESFGLVWYSLGIGKKDIEKLCELVKVGIQPNLCVDVANGYSDEFVKKIEEIRTICPKSIIMAGNVATHEMVAPIIRQGGADIVKVGIGPGSACTTRIVTGVGYPQLSAVLECADDAHGNCRGYICADGGCKEPGDIVKAFGGNADFVMLGGMLAGTDECDGDWLYEETLMESRHSLIINQGPAKAFRFHGMSSEEAQEKHYGGMKDYRASEGREVWIPAKGPADEVCKHIEGGIRGGCSSIGAGRIKDVGKCTTFIMVHNTHNRVYENNYVPSTKEH